MNELETPVAALSASLLTIQCRSIAQKEITATIVQTFVRCTNHTLWPDADQRVTTLHVGRAKT